MPARFPAFPQITSRFHFQQTAIGKLAQPTSFRLASSVVLARSAPAEFLSATRCVPGPRTFDPSTAADWRTPSSSSGRLRQEAASSTAASPPRKVRSCACARRDKLGETRGFVSEEAREISAGVPKLATESAWLAIARYPARVKKSWSCGRSLKHGGIASVPKRTETSGGWSGGEWGRASENKGGGESESTAGQKGAEKGRKRAKGAGGGGRAT